jgi:hypothetical protein
MESTYKALNYTLRMIQGDTFDRSYTMYDVDAEGVQTALDISDKILRGQLRLEPEGTEVVNFLISTEDSGSGVVDTFRLRLGANITSGMAAGVWQYDVELVDSANQDNVQKIMKGTVVIRPEITR